MKLCFVLHEIWSPVIILAQEVYSPQRSNPATCSPLPTRQDDECKDRRDMETPLDHAAYVHNLWSWIVHFHSPQRFTDCRNAESGNVGSEETLDAQATMILGQNS
jgi:hypothetical protein